MYSDNDCRNSNQKFNRCLQNYFKTNLGDLLLNVISGEKKHDKSKTLNASLSCILWEDSISDQRHPVLLQHFSDSGTIYKLSILTD